MSATDGSHLTKYYIDDYKVLPVVKEMKLEKYNIKIITTM